MINNNNNNYNKTKQDKTRHESKSILQAIDWELEWEWELELYISISMLILHHLVRDVLESIYWRFSWRSRVYLLPGKQQPFEKRWARAFKCCVQFFKRRIHLIQWCELFGRGWKRYWLIYPSIHPAIPSHRRRIIDFLAWKLVFPPEGFTAKLTTIWDRSKV